MDSRAHSRRHIIALLCEAFATNKSVNYVVKPGGRKARRIAALMAFACDTCQSQYIVSNADGSAVALCDFPYRKPGTFRDYLLQARLVLNAIGITRVSSILKREAYIKQQHPKSPFMYLWFMGVSPAAQGKGHGTELLQTLIAESERRQLPIYLETSAEKNLAFYERQGFAIYHTWHNPEAGFPVWFMRR